MVLLAGLGLTGQAQAISGADRARLGSTIVPNGSVVPEYTNGSVTFREGNGNTTRIGHTWDQQPSRHTRLSEKYQVPVGGNLIEYNRRTLVPPSSIVKGAGLILKTLPFVATGVAIWELYDKARIRPDGNGGLLEDPGTAQVNVPKLRVMVGISGGGYGSHNKYVYGEGATGLRAAVITAIESTGRPWRSVSCNTSQCTAETYVGYWSWSTFQPVNNVSMPECPASTDASNPEYSIPAGMPPDADGKCRTARYNHVPVGFADAADKVEQAAPPAAEDLPGLAEDVLNQGGTLPDVTPETGTGPGNVTGNPTTTTTTSGQGTTTKTSTPTTNYYYAGDTITYNVTTVTVTNNNGDTTTETHTTPLPTGAGTPPEDPEDPCTANPDRLGCIKLGTAPVEATPKKGWQATWSAVGLGLPSGCPADVDIGLETMISYQPTCQAATNIRPFILVGAVWAALMLVLAAIRGS